MPPSAALSPFPPHTPPPPLSPASLRYKQGITEMWRVDDFGIRMLAGPTTGRATQFLYAIATALSDLYREKQVRCERGRCEGL